MTEETLVRLLLQTSGTLYKKIGASRQSAGCSLIERVRVRVRERQA